MRGVGPGIAGCQHDSHKGANTYRLVDADVKDILALSAVLDHTGLSDLDGTVSVRLWEDRVPDNGVDKVRGRGFGIRSGDGTLLQAVSSEVGVSEVLCDLSFERVRQVSLRVSKVIMRIG